MIAQSPKAREYKQRKNLNLKSSSFVYTSSISDIGKIKEFERRVNLNVDQKRLWFEKIRNVNDKRLIDSLPLSLSYFDKEVLWLTFTSKNNIPIQN